jgi:hypothetical protein
MNGEGLTFRQIAVLIVVTVALIGLAYTFSMHPIPANEGFGPEWDCTHIGKGAGPICIKKPPGNAVPSN